MSRSNDTLNPTPPTTDPARPDDVIVEALDLVKEFPTPSGALKRAVAGVSFVVRRGEIYGLLGPNGAGKTTTLRMLSGMMAPTTGQAWLNHREVTGDLEAVKRQIGLLTANTGLYQRLTPRETLVFFAEMYGCSREAAAERAEVLCTWLDMIDFADLRCGALSTGQRQRVNIARSVVADPPILIMDEPTLGLDVLSNRIILDFIRSERDAGKTIILSTHHLHEAEDLCNRIGLLHEGKLVAEGTLAELRTTTSVTGLDDIFLTLVKAGPTGLGRRPDEKADA
jgi:ABC-type multidrug transport system ATPase subunit